MFKIILLLLLLLARNAEAQVCKVSQTGIDLVKQFELFRAEPYVDRGNGRWTVGYGHQQSAKPGKQWTEQKASAVLRGELNSIAESICERLTVNVSQHQLDSLTSLAYNMGKYGLFRSSLFKQVNLGNFKAASRLFPIYNKSKKRTIKGLVIRRKTEQLIFLTKDAVKIDIRGTIYNVRNKIGG